MHRTREISGAAELQEKYDQAIKQLGEKKLELGILRELVKKHPDWTSR